VPSFEENVCPADFLSGNIGPSPRSTAVVNEVTFNYSDNNHHFRIGQGDYEFETAWSKCGTGAIRCYNDPPSIRGIALAPDASKLADITDASRLNYSNRDRKVHAGQFVVLQNTKAFYVAIKILEVLYDDA